MTDITDDAEPFVKTETVQVEEEVQIEVMPEELQAAGWVWDPEGELTETTEENKELLDAMSTAIEARHYAEHSGAIRFCIDLVCRTTREG